LTQVLLFGGAYLLYSAGRWLAIGDRATATATARDLLQIERDLGIAVERGVQRAIDADVVLALLNWAYLAAQVAVVPVVLVLCWKVAPPVYHRLRDTVLLSWVAALPVYALLPVAPPRLADVGIVDTIERHAELALDSRLATSFYNPLAAVPSLHAGFALAVSVALWRASRHLAPGHARALRAGALAWTPLIVLAVVATGNHFVLDVAAGFALAGAMDLVAGARARRRGPRGAVRRGTRPGIPTPVTTTTGALR
jgi:membrane-associated phospholipid phosphatase